MFLYMTSRLSKFRSVHTYVMPRMLYFKRYCIVILRNQRKCFVFNFNTNYKSFAIKQQKKCQKIVRMTKLSLLTFTLKHILVLERRIKGSTCCYCFTFAYQVVRTMLLLMFFFIYSKFYADMLR